MPRRYRGLNVEPAADNTEKVDVPAGDPSEEIENALHRLATGYLRTSYKIRRRQGKVTLVSVERIVAPNTFARRLISQQRKGGRALLRKLDKAKRGKR